MYKRQLYEDASRRKVEVVTTLLSGLESVQAAVEAVQAAESTSQELKTLCSWGQGTPDFREALKVRNATQLLATTTISGTLDAVPLQ